MSIDWDAELLGPVMAVFGEGSDDDPSSWPTYTPVSGTPFQLASAVFTEQYQRTVVGEDSSQSEARPILGVRDSLFAALPDEPQANASVYIPSVGKTYRVTHTEPDGVGKTVLFLGETAVGNS